MGIFGGSKKRGANQRDEPSNEKSALDLASDARREAWGLSGNSDFVTQWPPPENRELMGPLWPAYRQGYGLIETDDGSVLVSDGLSDPFAADHPLVGAPPSGNAGVGYGVEFYVKSNERFRSLADALGSWQMIVLQKIVANFIDYGGFPSDDFGFTTMDLYDLPVDQSFYADDVVCALVGLELSTIPRSFRAQNGEVLLLSVVLMNAVERPLAMQGGIHRKMVADLRLSACGDAMTVVS